VTSPRRRLRSCVARGFSAGSFSGSELVGTDDQRVRPYIGVLRSRMHRPWWKRDRLCHATIPVLYLLPCAPSGAVVLCRGTSRLDAVNGPTRNSFRQATTDPGAIPVGGHTRIQRGKPPALHPLQGYGLLEGRSYPYEVLVVDDGSADQTREIVEKPPPGTGILTGSESTSRQSYAVRTGVLRSAGATTLLGRRPLRPHRRGREACFPPGGTLRRGHRLARGRGSGAL
jgi:hypothetical protein